MSSTRQCDGHSLVSGACQHLVKALEVLAIMLDHLGGDLLLTIISNNLAQHWSTSSLDSQPSPLVHLYNDVMLETSKTMLNGLMQIKAARGEREPIPSQIYVLGGHLMDLGVVEGDERLAPLLVRLNSLGKVATHQVITDLPCCRLLGWCAVIAVLCLHAGQHSSDAQHMQQAISAAVRDAMHLNSGVVQRGQQLYLTLADGTERQLCSSLEGHKLALACSCSKGHVRYSTLNSVRSLKALLCQYCHHGTPAWREARRRRVFKSEKKAMQALKSQQLDSRVACEVRLWYWHGRVDFFDIPSKTAMQADGEKRSAKLQSKLPGKQLQLDLHCCISAWHEGGRMLRLHTKDSNWGAVMRAAVAQQHPRFVMLTSAYAAVHAGSGGVSCIDWLKQHLEGAQYTHDPSLRYHLFHPTLTL